jgi:hypothetical protein
MTWQSIKLFYQRNRSNSILKETRKGVGDPVKEKFQFIKPF